MLERPPVLAYVMLPPEQFLAYSKEKITETRTRESKQCSPQGLDIGWKMCTKIENFLTNRLIEPSLNEGTRLFMHIYAVWELRLFAKLPFVRAAFIVNTLTYILMK